MNIDAYTRQRFREFNDEQRSSGNGSPIAILSKSRHFCDRLVERVSDPTQRKEIIENVIRFVKQNSSRLVSRNGDITIKNREYCIRMAITEGRPNPLYEAKHVIVSVITIY